MAEEIDLNEELRKVEHPYKTYPLEVLQGPQAELFWQMRNGDVILIADMTAEHLINTINLLIRTAGGALDRALSCFPSFQGELAQFFAEQDYNSLLQTTPEEFLAQRKDFQTMMRVAYYRGLLTNEQHEKFLEWLEFPTRYDDEKLREELARIAWEGGKDDGIPF